MAELSTTALRPAAPVGAALMVLGTLSFCHMLNDIMQSVLQALYPMLKAGLGLSFTEIGAITLVYQFVASVLQPLIGRFTDRHPLPYSLSFSMGFTLTGLLVLSVANALPWVLLAAALIGVGSAVFHPEASRLARLASGGQHGLAQSLFQVGGNFGSALGPLAAAFIILPHGQSSVAWFALASLTGIVLLTLIARWAQGRGGRARQKSASLQSTGLSPQQTRRAMAVLLALIFSKYVYMASLTSYYTLYLISHFNLPVADAQVDLFVFLGAVAAGTILGGPIGDRIGRKTVIWCSILGVLPFTLALPYMDLTWTIIMTVPIGFVLASAFPAIVVYALELMPGQTGTISGLFFGFAFGVAGIAAAVLGKMADLTSIDLVYRCVAFMPLLGFLAALLPRTSKPRFS